MALGMAKDSMVDLQSLVQEKMDASGDGGGTDTLSLLTTGQSRRCATEYGKLARDANPADDGKDEEELYKEVESEEATKARESRTTPRAAYLDGESSALAQPSSPQGTFDMEEEKKQDSYGHYAGFANDYEDYSYDPYVVHYQHPPQTLLGGKKSSSEDGGFLCCFFPWLRNDPNAKITQYVGESEKDGLMKAAKEESVAVAKQDNFREPLRKSSSLGEDDDVSTGDASVGSDKLGERLSEKDRQAVLARLRLAQPDLSSITTPSDAAAASPTAAGGGKDKVQPKGLLNNIPNISSADSDLNDSKSEISAGSGVSGGSKGILKRQSTVIKNPEPQSDNGGGSKRRSLFPTYGTTSKAKKNDNHVEFAPMARVVTVKSQKDMTPEEKSAIWWQKWDYEDFRKTGRIITRAMLEGGSEIWLASNQSWQHQGSTRQTTLKNAMSLSEQAAKKATSNGTTDIIRSTGDKWWHKFGHSRRGLEHIASIKEGSERQTNVRHAIRSTLDEQKRQKAYLREDPEKLRMVSIHNTSWARDLALASGSSDADAVKSNFDEERKSREFYLLKMARTNLITSRGKHVPAFMQPAISTTFAHKLDANTQAQIMYRQKQQRALLQQAQQQQARSASPPRPPTQRMSMPPSVGGSSNKIMDCEPIHDPVKEGKKDLAKRAAGFSHDGAQQVNMAAVLSGMGAVPKSAQTVGA